MIRNLYLGLESSFGIIFSPQYLISCASEKAYIEPIFYNYNYKDFEMSKIKNVGVLSGPLLQHFSAFHYFCAISQLLKL